MAVICYHFGFAWLPGGFSGVDVFFVISGFLITQIVVSELKHDSFSLWSFYFRRARRTMPALVAMILVMLVIAPLTSLPKDLSDLGRSAIAGLFGVSNWYFYHNTDYFDQAAALMPLLHTWSLGVEWQFYLIWPVVLVLVRKLNERLFPVAIAVAIIVSFVVNLFLIGNDPKQAFYLPFARVWELALGGILVFVPKSKVQFPGLFGLAMVLTGMFAFDTAVPYPGAAALLPCVGTALLIVTPIRFMGWWPQAIVGRASYSLYLWHWPVLALFAYRTAHLPTTIAEICFIAIFIVTLSAISWRFIELPFLRLRSTRPRLVLMNAFLGLAFIAILPSWFVQSGGLPNRFSAQELILINDVPRRGLGDNDGRSCSGRPPNDPCILGDKLASPAWALLGDSHAETLMSSIDAAWKERGMGGYVFTYPGCPFILGSRRLDTGADCGQFVEHVLVELQKRGVQHVIIQDRANAYLVGTPFDNGEGGVEPGPSIAVTVGNAVGEDRRPAVGAALESTMKFLLNQGIDIYYLLAPPEVGWNAPQKALEALRARAGPVTTSFDLYLTRNRPLKDVLSHSTHPKLKVVESARPFCDAVRRRCSIGDHAGLYYTDTDHLSEHGAQRLVNLIFSAVDARVPPQ